MVASTKECLLVIQHDNNDDRFFLAKEMYDFKKSIRLLAMLSLNW